MTDTEERFNRYWQTLDEKDPFKGATILDLTAARSAEIKDLAKAFSDVKTETNGRFAMNAADIIAPDGPVHLHMDYIASPLVNACAFQFEGWYFIALTEGMLEIFAKSCIALWRLNPLFELLGVADSVERKNSVFQFILLLELQYISNHELGHMFHGHCTDFDKGRYRPEFSVQRMVAESIGMEGQARELEADGYAINLLLKNLLKSDSGSQMHDRVGSAKPVREFILTLFVLSLGAVLYYVEPLPFDPDKVRIGDHTEGLARMNILMGEILGWCKDNVDWNDALPIDKFQTIMDFVAIAASDPTQEEIWKGQGEYLQTDEGKAYLNDIYKRRVNLRSKMSPHHWKLRSEETSQE